jgi:hypothetical protein
MDASEREQTLYILAYLFGVVWLLGWEASAFIQRKTTLTISDFTWTLKGWWYIPRVLIGIGLVVLALHLVFGWIRA